MAATQQQLILSFSGRMPDEDWPEPQEIIQKTYYLDDDDEQTERPVFRPPSEMTGIVECSEHEDGPWQIVNDLETARLFSHLRVRKPCIPGVVIITPSWVRQWN